MVRCKDCGVCGSYKLVEFSTKIGLYLCKMCLGIREMDYET